MTVYLLSVVLSINVGRFIALRSNPSYEPLRPIGFMGGEKKPNVVVIGGGTGSFTYLAFGATINLPPL